MKTIKNIVQKGRKKFEKMNAPKNCGYRVGEEFMGAMKLHINSRIIEVLEGVKKEVESKKTEDTDYRNNDYTRGMEAGKNYLIDDVSSLITNFIDEIKK